MAVEIRELIIKALVVAEDDRKAAPPRGLIDDMQRDEIIQQCVNEALKIIKKGKNR